MHEEVQQQKHCRLVAVVGPRGEYSVSSRARCVWLTSRPSWPLEGGRPREVSRSRARYRLLGHARGPSSHHLRSSAAVHDTPADDAVRRKRRRRRGRGRRAARASKEREREKECKDGRGYTEPTAGDRITFRYLYDARPTSDSGLHSHPWRARIRGGKASGFGAGL